MKRIISLILASVIAAPPSAAATPAPEYDGYLVRLSEPLAPVVAELSGCEPVDDHIYYADSLTEVGVLSLFGEVECWTTNDVLETQDCYDDYDTELWNLRAVGASAGWNHTDKSGIRDRLGDGVTVAVVDSGIMADHPDLAEAHIMEYIALSSEEDGLDDFHGTFVTGLLAAAVNNGTGVDGMVPDVNILPVCITHNGGKTDVRTAVAGIDKAVELGADVISFSIGGTRDNEILRQACQDAADAGVILVTCAGNYSSGAKHSADRYMYPAAYDCVVTVSACRQTEEGVAFDADYSYFNDAVTVSAPGTDIRSLYLDGYTATKTGTSFAAPVVTAMAVMAKEADRSICTEDFIQLLRASSADLGDPGFDPYYGFGFVNVSSFLNALDERISKGRPDPEDDDSPHDICPGARFADMPPVTSYAHEPIDWAVSNGITGGIDDTHFSPEGGCTRGQVVTFLWRAAGCPVPKSATTPFKDLKPGAFYENAVAWAVEKDVTNGLSAERFGPEEICTRGQIVTLLWRFKGCSDSAGKEAAFNDVNAGTFCARAVAWAAGCGITNGMEEGFFRPENICTRAQVVTFLYRAERD